jgi:hypothetical protein
MSCSTVVSEVSEETTLKEAPQAQETMSMQYLVNIIVKIRVVSEY